jgi:hypothetical protein
VHGEEVDARADVLLGERPLVGVAVGAGPLLVDPDDVEVERVAVARVACERRDPRKLGDRVVVGLDVPSPDLSVALELVELAEGDRGMDVREVRLEAGDADVIERPVASAHQPELPDRVSQVVVVGRDGASFARGDVLRRVEREAGGPRDGTHLAAAILGLDRVGGILDDRDPRGDERVEVGWLAREIDGHDRLRPRRDRLDRELGVDVQVVLAHVDEDRPRAEVDGDVGRCRPRDRRRDDLVPLADPETGEREVQGGRSRREGEGVPRARQLGDSLLELRRPGTGREPAAPESLRDRSDLLRPDCGRLEGEKGVSTGGSGAHVAGSLASERRAMLGRREPAY